MKIPFAVLAVFLLCGTVHATDHIVDLTIHDVSGSIGWHFSRYDGQVKKDVDIYGVTISVPTGGSRFTKIRNRDDDSSRMHSGETWHDTFTVSGPGIYILDFSDWHDNPNVEVRLTIDDVLRFSAHGTTDNLAGWDREIGSRVRQTDDREIAIDLE